MRNPIVPDIEIELLKFADGLRHIARSVQQGSMGEEEANRLKNKLAGVYAKRIARIVKEDDAEIGGPAPEGTGLLVEFGVEPLTARRLAARCSVKDIEGWITYAHRGKGLDNPQGLVVSRLRAGVPAPEVVSPGAQRRRDYLGQYAEVIKH